LLTSITGDRDWHDIWLDSEELANVKSEIVQIKAERSQAVRDAPKRPSKEFATPLWHQIKIVNRRQQKAFWRSPNYGFTRFFNHVAIALLTGLMFLQLDDSRSSLQYRVFVIFQVTVLPALILAQVEPKYDLSRLIYYREAAAKTYRQLPFALSMVLAEMPYSILCAVGFFLPIYYIPGFNMDSSRAGYNFFMVLVTEIFAVTLAQMVSALTPSTFIAMLLNPPLIIVFALFCGVTVSHHSWEDPSWKNMQTCSARPTTRNKDTDTSHRSPNLRSPASGAPGSTSSTRKSQNHPCCPLSTPPKKKTNHP
jgi:ATP-binding cassette subfamily G (WHITE) protein 2 (SNQ2)